MDSPDLTFDLADLCDQAGVTARTVRYYIQQGLLPQPGAGREARKYGPAYLNRLRLIRQLQREHLPLAEIRQRLTGLSDADVEAASAPHSPTSAAAPSARDYLDQVLGPRAPASPSAVVAEPAAKLMSRLSVPTFRAEAPPAPESAGATADAWPRLREQWERLTLHDDVELHIRRPASRDMNRRIERLLEIARRILHDDPQR